VSCHGATQGAWRDPAPHPRQRLPHRIGRLHPDCPCMLPSARPTKTQQTRGARPRCRRAAGNVWSCRPRVSELARVLDLRIHCCAGEECTLEDKHQACQYRHVLSLLGGYKPRIHECGTGWRRDSVRLGILHAVYFIARSRWLCLRMPCPRLLVSGAPTRRQLHGSEPSNRGRASQWVHQRGGGRVQVEAPCEAPTIRYCECCC
jgi:hypothetical protein